MRSLHPYLQARLAALQQYKIKHASLEKMDTLLMNAIDEHTSYGILALYGPSGVGKSTVMKRIAERCREEERDSSVVPEDRRGEERKRTRASASPGQAFDCADERVAPSPIVHQCDGESFTRAVVSHILPH
ncbi:ATP-binding protein [Ktedonobacter racemifer]|uniref:ATP-binding protein n=1 Tax=Ktedonobacter racemifer TaxID=363277 RepID=UPI00058ACAA5|nr:ATP-binding protein [Ktedonobacter racemifer]